MTSTDPIHIISLGAGVQSSTMALMAAAGEITPMPKCAIFADTKWEPKAVYDWLDWLERQLPFPVYRVSNGDIKAEIAAIRPSGKFLKVNIPAFVAVNGKPSGLINRSCTQDYKIIPIRRKVREILGLTRKRSPSDVRVIQWIGISTDETLRMKDSRESYCKHRWPLIELGVSRIQCLKWLEDNGYPKAPKSACIGCPFHADAQWLALTPDEFSDAVAVDHRLRSQPAEKYRTKGVLYLHRSCQPLETVQFRKPVKPEMTQIDMFNNECEGMCGV